MASYMVDMSSSLQPVMMEEVRARFNKDAYRNGQTADSTAAMTNLFPSARSVVTSSKDQLQSSKHVSLLPSVDLHSGYESMHVMMPTAPHCNPSPMQGMLPQKSSGKKRERVKGSSRGAAKRPKLEPEGIFETTLEGPVDGVEEREAQQKFQQPLPPPAKRRNRQRQKRPLTTDEDAGEKAPPKRRNKPKASSQFSNPSLSQPLIPQPISASNTQTKNYLDVYGLKVKVNKASDINKFIEDYTVEDLLTRNPKPLFSPFLVAEQGESHDTFSYQIGEVLQLLPRQCFVASSTIEQKPPLPLFKYTLDLESLPQPEDDFHYGPSDIDQYMSQSSSSHGFSVGNLPLSSFGEFVKSIELPPSNSLEYLISKSDSTLPSSTTNKLPSGANCFEENDGTMMRMWLRAGTPMTSGRDSVNEVCQWEANNNNKTTTPTKGGENLVPMTDNRSVAVVFSCLDIDLNKESPQEEDNEANLEYDTHIRQTFQSLPVDTKEEEEDTDNNDRRHAERNCTPFKNIKEEPIPSTREWKEEKSPVTEIQCDEGKTNNLGNSSLVEKDLKLGYSVNGDENPLLPVSRDHAEHPPPPPSGQDLGDDGPISPRVHAAAQLLWSFANSHRGKPSSTSHTHTRDSKKMEEERLSEVSSSIPAVAVPPPVPKRRAIKNFRNSTPQLPLGVAPLLGQERASSGISASTSNNYNNSCDEEFHSNSNKKKKKEGRYHQNRNNEQENYRTSPDIASIPSKRTPDRTTVTNNSNNNNTAKKQQQHPTTARYQPQTCRLRELDKAKVSNNPPSPSPTGPLIMNGNSSSGSRSHVIKFRPQSPPQNSNNNNNNNNAGGSPANSSRQTHPFFGVVSQRARN